MKRPAVGSVIRYAYLWAEEAQGGPREGIKDRPCAVVVADQDGTILVLPITHSAPTGEEKSVELPNPVKRRLGLDEARSWIVTTEYNRFTWPGPDIRPAANGEAILGELPSTLLRRAVTALRENALAGRLKAANRR